MPLIFGQKAGPDRFCLHQNPSSNSSWCNVDVFGCSAKYFAADRDTSGNAVAGRKADRQLPLARKLLRFTALRIGSGKQRWHPALRNPTYGGNDRAAAQ